jgi:hypothetical protein
VNKCNSTIIEVQQVSVLDWAYATAQPPDAEKNCPDSVFECYCGTKAPKSPVELVVSSEVIGTRLGTMLMQHRSHRAMNAGCQLLNESLPVFEGAISDAGPAIRADFKQTISPFKVHGSSIS